MRKLQIIVLAMGILSLLAAIPFIGTDAGDALYKAGGAALLADVVCIMLWPRSPGDRKSRVPTS